MNDIIAITAIAVQLILVFVMFGCKPWIKSSVKEK